MRALLLVNFADRTSLYGPRLGHKRTGKNSVRNLQYGPPTRLVRAMYTTNSQSGQLPANLVAQL